MYLLRIRPPPFSTRRRRYYAPGSAEIASCVFPPIGIDVQTPPISQIAPSALPGHFRLPSAVPNDRRMRRSRVDRAIEERTRWLMRLTPTIRSESIGQ